MSIRGSQTHGDSENTDFKMSDKVAGMLTSLWRIKSQRAMQISRWFFTKSLALQATIYECAATGQLVNPQFMCTVHGIPVALEMQERNTNEHTCWSKVFHTFPLLHIPEGASTIYSGKTTQGNKQLQEPHGHLKLGDWHVVICQTNLTARNQGFQFHQQLLVLQTVMNSCFKKSVQLIGMVSEVVCLLLHSSR